MPRDSSLGVPPLLHNHEPAGLALPFGPGRDLHGSECGQPTTAAVADDRVLIVLRQQIDRRTTLTRPPVGGGPAPHEPHHFVADMGQRVLAVQIAEILVVQHQAFAAFLVRFRRLPQEIVGARFHQQHLLSRRQLNSQIHEAAQLDRHGKDAQRLVAVIAPDRHGEHHDQIAVVGTLHRGGIVDLAQGALREFLLLMVIAAAAVEVVTIGETSAEAGEAFTRHLMTGAAHDLDAVVRLHKPAATANVGIVLLIARIEPFLQRPPRRFVARIGVDAEQMPLHPGIGGFFFQDPPEGVDLVCQHAGGELSRDLQSLFAQLVLTSSSRFGGRTQVAFPMGLPSQPHGSEHAQDGQQYQPATDALGPRAVPSGPAGQFAPGGSR